MSKLNGRWLRDAKTDAEKLYTKRTIAGSRNFIETFKNVLKNVEQEIVSDKTARPDYIDAAWPYRQAHINGGLEMLDRIKDLLPANEVLDQLTKEIKQL